MKASFIRCGSPTTTTQVMARKKRRGVNLLSVLVKEYFWCYVEIFGSLRFLFFSFVCQIIEKRRRDRINNSLSELRRLVPTAFEKQVSLYLENYVYEVPQGSHRIQTEPINRLLMSGSLKQSGANQRSGQQGETLE